MPAKGMGVLTAHEICSSDEAIGEVRTAGTTNFCSYNEPSYKASLFGKRTLDHPTMVRLMQEC